VSRKKITTKKSIVNFLISPSFRGLALCAAGGALCSVLHTPLPWMIGPLLSMALAKLFGLDVRAPYGGRQTGQVLIGCTLGLYFTPAVAGTVQSHALAMLIAAILSIILGYLCAFFLSRLSGVDRTTAFFASVAGGAAEMGVLAERHGAALDKVAFAQSLRILLVVVIVPALLTLSGAHGADQYQPLPGDVAYPGLALMLSLCVAAGGLLAWIGMPNAWMLVPLFVTIAITVTETHLSAMPKELSNLGQLLIGCALGGRFERSFLRSSHRYLFGVIATIAFAMVLAALFGTGMAWFTKIPVPTVILATAPGGIGEMGITAKVLQLGVPLVTAFHLTRIVVIVTTTGPLFSMVQRAKMHVRKSRRVEKFPDVD